MRPIRERRRRASSTVPPRASIYALVIVVRWTQGWAKIPELHPRRALGRYSRRAQVSRTTLVLSIAGTLSHIPTLPRPTGTTMAQTVRKEQIVAEQQARCSLCAL